MDLSIFVRMYVNIPMYSYIFVYVYLYFLRVFHKNPPVLQGDEINEVSVLLG